MHRRLARGVRGQNCRNKSQPFPGCADKRPVGDSPLIELTRLNGTRLTINSDLIQYMESSPDSTLTLINGEKLVVSESSEQIIELTLAYRARLVAEAARQCPEGLVVALNSLCRADAALQTTSPEGHSHQPAAHPYADPS